MRIQKNRSLSWIFARLTLRQYGDLLPKDDILEGESRSVSALMSVRRWVIQGIATS